MAIPFLPKNAFVSCRLKIIPQGRRQRRFVILNALDFGYS